MVEQEIAQIPGTLAEEPALDDELEVQDKSDLTDGSRGTSKKMQSRWLPGRTNGSLLAARLGASQTNILFGRSSAGAGVGEEIPCTALARQLLAAADAATMRTGMGVAIGSDVQAYSANLASVAAGLTAAGLTLLSAADAAAQRAALALGSMALQAAGSVAITGGTIAGTTVDGVSIKSYVDNLIAGLKWKATVKAATTAAGTLATDFENGDTLDGVALTTGDRILIKDQAAGAENGIYIVAASGAPTRAPDADAGAELVNATVIVEQGTANADKAFVCTNDSITLGSTAIVFVNYAVAITGALLAANNLSDLANVATARSNLGLGALALLASVATANLDAGAVSLAKMANVAERGLFLRTTAGSGPPEVQVVAANVASILTAADYAAIRTLLSLVPGTDVQAFSSNLASVAAGLTAAGLALIDDATAGDQRNTLGLGSMATQAASAVAITGGTASGFRITPRVQTVASAATVTPNADADDVVTITAQAEALTLANPSGTPTEGQKLTIRIKDNTTARAISFGSQYRALGNTLPTTTTISKTLYLGLVYNSTDTKWDLVAKTEQA